MGMGKLAARIAVNTGRYASYPGEMSRLPGRMVMPLSQLGNNGCLL